MMRKLEVTLKGVLDLVGCADSYGHNNSVLLSSFAKMTGWVTDEEIEEYVVWFVSPEGQAQGYGEEDRDEQRDRLVEWRDLYCKRS